MKFWATSSFSVFPGIGFTCVKRNDDEDQKAVINLFEKLNMESQSDSSFSNDGYDPFYGVNMY